MAMLLSQTLTFFRQYLTSPGVVGAVTPSSRYLAAALAAPFARRREPARVLEVGAGTGSVTRALARHFGPADRLDVCEIEPTLADVLESGVLRSGVLGAARREGRVRLIRGPVQEICAPDTYDFVVSSLPFNAFGRADVQQILTVIERNLKPGGVFSYFEYIGVRLVRSSFPLDLRRRRFREVSAFLKQQIKSHQVARKTVWLNIPPAHARHWRFDAPQEQAA